MNRYPVWKYAIIVVALLVGIIYTLPNFFGEAPAVQVASVKATVAVEMVDLRLQAVEVSGQDIMTRDKVSLRLNLCSLAPNAMPRCHHLTLRRLPRCR